MVLKSILFLTTLLIFSVDIFANRQNSGPWFPSVSPSEHGSSSRRTHFYETSSSVTEENPHFQVKTAENVFGLYNMVTRGPDEVFALGGSFGMITQTNELGQYNSPYIVKFDAHSLRELWRTRLPEISPKDWNYPGALGVHANGDLYVLYGHHIARVNPATGSIVAHRFLPTNQSEVDVAYNGFTLMSDGFIVAKSIHRKPGCTAPDFLAFIKCETDGVAPSSIVVIDPETLEIKQVVYALEHLRFRVTATTYKGKEFIYIPGHQFIHRYSYSNGQLALDDHWKASYRLDGQTAGTAVAALNDWVVIQTNGIPSKVPLSIVAISQEDSEKKFHIEPFKESTKEGSFIPSLPTVDEELNRVYTFDGFAGEVAALDFSSLHGFEVAWKEKDRSYAFSALVGSKEARVFVGTSFTNKDYDKVPYATRLKLMTLGSKPLKEQIVWRDAKTGKELARSLPIVAVAGSVPTPGYGGTLYVPDLSDGRLILFSPEESITF